MEAKMFDTVATVDLGDVDLEDDSFKLSRNKIDEQLKRSVREWGLLDLPVLLRRSVSKSSPDDHGFEYPYQIIFGHNRLRILRELHGDSTAAYTVDRIVPERYVRYAFLKGLRGEIGPVGKVKLLTILRDFLHIDADVITLLCRNLQIPEFISRDERGIHTMSNFPALLRDYLDSRNIGFRVIKDLLRLESDGIHILCSWIEHVNFRVNYFKELVDCMADIRIRDGDLTRLRSLAIPEEKGKREEDLFEEVFRIRYPEYSEQRDAARTIIRSLERRGVEVDFPRYFEDDRIVVKIPVMKREGSPKIVERFEGIDLQEIDQLLSLL